MAYKIKKVNEYRERRDFSRVNKSLELADLLEIQTKSYNWFIQEGIKEVLEEIELKRKLSPNTYKKLIQLYKEAKEKIKNQS